MDQGQGTVDTVAVPGRSESACGHDDGRGGRGVDDEGCLSNLLLLLPRRKIDSASSAMRDECIRHALIIVWSPIAREMPTHQPMFRRLLGIYSNKCNPRFALGSLRQQLTTNEHFNFFETQVILAMPQGKKGYVSLLLYLSCPCHFRSRYLRILNVRWAGSGYGSYGSEMKGYGSVHT